MVQNMTKRMMIMLLMMKVTKKMMKMIMMFPEPGSKLSECLLLHIQIHQILLHLRGSRKVATHCTHTHCNF
jgi:hypothetical protein